jgi:DDE family transposase
VLNSFRNSLLRARQQESLCFAALLSEETINQAFGPARDLWQGWVYTPAVTVWVFLSQCLSADHSCREAVARLITWRLARGQKACSSETSAYCAARDALPEAVGQQLVRITGRQLEEEAPKEWLFHGRRVRVVDGTTITMPDTTENQSEYPQQPGQKPGCGFPIARVLVVFSLSVGTVLEAMLGRYEGKLTGENSQFRKIHNRFEPNEIVVADRSFSGWFDLALLQDRWIDVIVRKHQARETDFRRGARLGHDDHLVTWKKPARPQWMSVKQYAAMPDELVLREVRIKVAQRGFRSKVIVVVTTLLDDDEFSKEEITELYRRRWQAELNLRSLKALLQMDHLRCKTPHRVRNEFYMHLLAYNLIRRVMALAAAECEIPPWAVSFKGTLQTLNQFLPLLTNSITIDEWCAALIRCIVVQPVGNRPDRIEPRLVKKRPKQYKWLMKPRAQYKNQLV